MEILSTGEFSFEIDAEELARGLRPSKRVPRNRKYLVECSGAVGLDQVLQVIDDLENDRLDTAATITDGFPYPQIFVFTNLIIVCGETDIYEWVAGALVHELGPVAAGAPWVMIDFYNYVYASNGVVAVRRRHSDRVWETTTDLPTATAMCNFNGQVLIGGPEEEWA